MSKVFFDNEIEIKKVNVKSGEEVMLEAREDEIDVICEGLVNSWGEETTIQSALYMGELLTLCVEYEKGHVEVGIVNDEKKEVPLFLYFDIDFMEEYGHKGPRPFAYLLEFGEHDFECLENFAIPLMLTIMRLKKNKIF